MVAGKVIYLGSHDHRISRHAELRVLCHVRRCRVLIGIECIDAIGSGEQASSGVGGGGPYDNPGTLSSEVERGGYQDVTAKTIPVAGRIIKDLRLAYNPVVPREKPREAKPPKLTSLAASKSPFCGQRP